MHSFPCIFSLWALCCDNGTGLFPRQGMDSSQDEIGASAILGAQLDEELGGGPVQVTTLFLLPASCFLLLFSPSSCPVLLLFPWLKTLLVPMFFNCLHDILSVLITLSLMLLLSSSLWLPIISVSSGCWCSYNHSGILPHQPLLISYHSIAIRTQSWGMSASLRCEPTDGSELCLMKKQAFNLVRWKRVSDISVQCVSMTLCKFFIKSFNSAHEINRYICCIPSQQ